MKKGLATRRRDLIAALDVGSSKVCCLIARVDDTGRPRVVGIGQQASRGVKNGAIVDMEAAEHAILVAVHAAEQMADETIESVYVNLSGGKPESHAMAFEVSIDGHAIDDSDLRRIMRMSRQVQPGEIGTARHAGPANGANGHGGALNGSGANGTSADARDCRRQLLHCIPTGYAIDGSRGIREPRGMYGDVLGCSVHLITADSGPIRNLSTCVKRCHLEIDGFVVSPYAAGLAALVEDELELGVTLIDMGGGTTSIAVFMEGSLVFADVIPIGGKHVTSDIARGLSTSLTHAERMKTLYGHAIASTADSRETIEVPRVGEDEHDSPQQIPRSLLTGIIQPRLEETFELVRAHLEISGFAKAAGRRVVLTGGASQVPGLRDLASLILDKQVRIGRPVQVTGLAESTGGPAYATAAGLLTYALEAETAAPADVRPEDREPSGFMGRLGHWFREYF